ncbi:MAG: hypothetical protein KUG79_09825 [Pseudomonadales bacterium]|nr:hypothetical protein [Pseudomonadales bacterium]
MKYLKWLLGLVSVLTLSLALGIFSMRYHDGPIEIFSGGPFSSGERVTGTEPDWEVIKDRSTIEFQMLEPGRSRTTWLAVHEGKLYVPSGYMNSTLGKIWKKWPYAAEIDGRALLRIDNKIYQRQLVRIAADNPIIPILVTEINRKYQAGATVENVQSNGTWVFELAPRG